VALPDAFTELEALRGRDGTFIRTLTLAITTGHKPAGGE
jgi:hypothetical protein